MVLQVKDFGDTEIKQEIVRYLKDCSTALDLSLSFDQMRILSEDLMELYQNDSLEDLRECLKKGRQGRYAGQVNTYAKLNMEVISGWMAIHLEAKYMAKEAELKKAKESEGKTFNSFDEVKEWYDKGNEFASKQKAKEDKDLEYQKFKSEYYAKRGGVQP